MSRNISIAAFILIIPFLRPVFADGTPANNIQEKFDMGFSHSCVVTSEGGVKCWGYDSNGQIGDGLSGTNRFILTPTDVSGLSSGVKAVSAGYSHVCVILTTGGVKCWGYNSNGQIGDNTSGTDRLAPTDVSGLSSGVQAITTGYFHTCALLTTGGVKCWGQGSYGQIGDNTTGTKLVPTDVSGLSSGVQAIAAGAYHTCALLTTGGVKCWGYNSQGQIGDNTSGTNRLVPTDVSGLSSGIKSLIAGVYHTCALLATGGMKCWGYNLNGQIGDNTTVNKLVPTDVSGLSSGVKGMAAGYLHTCALLITGGVKCWGGNDSDQIGDGTTITRLVPTDVINLNNIRAISAGNYYNCALMESGKLQCWGNNIRGQLGDGTISWKSVPTDVTGLSSGVQAMSVNYAHTCYLSSSGGVECWGNNDYGQLGDGTNLGKSVPTVVSGLSSGVQSVVAGGYHTCALLTTGGVKCWGNNGYGQVGDGTSGNNISTPVDVTGLSSGVQAIAAGDYHTCVLLTTGGVKCWGGNGYGSLGDGTTTGKTAPTDVSGLTSGVQAIAAGSYHTCALLTTGAVKCWGYNASGQIGDNTSGTNRLVPTDVSGLSSGVSMVMGGSSHTCALLTTGGVKCWGLNSNGQLGDGTTTKKLVPTDVSGLTSGAQAIAIGYVHSCALLTTGAVKCWGNNANGQIGDNTISTDRLVPTDVSGLTSGVQAIAAGGNNTCALAGSMKCWGDDGKWQLGLNIPVIHTVEVNGYTEPVAPTFVSVGESAASIVTSPINAGNNIGFSATASDTNGDQYYLLVCKTGDAPTANSLAAPSCNGGSSNQLCVSSATNSSSQASCSHSTTGETQESQVWYAFVCDNNSSSQCSAASQGSGDSGSPYYINHSPVYSTAAVRPAGNPGSSFSFTVGSGSWSDGDTVPAADTVKLLVCSSSGVTSGSCQGTQLCVSALTTAGNALSCNYDASSDPVKAAGTYDAYTYIVDEHGMEATGSGEGVNAGYQVNDVVPTFANISFNGGSAVDLTPGGTKEVYLKMDLIDSNGCGTLTTNPVSAMIYRSSVGAASCTSGNETSGCREVTRVSCAIDPESANTCGGGNDASVAYRCSVELPYYTDPTDGDSSVNPYAGDNWWANISLYDNSGKLTESEVGINGVINSLKAFDIGTSIDYGDLGPNTGNTYINIPMSVVNKGNTGLDLQVQGLGSGMCKDYPTCSSTVIHLSAQKWALNATTLYSGGGNVLTSSLSDVPLHLSKPTASTVTPAKSVYWGISIPAGTQLGDYTGEVSVVGTGSIPANW